MPEMYGIDSNWKFDAFVGVILGIGFIALSTLSPVIAIGIPDVPYSMG